MKENNELPDRLWADDGLKRLAGAVAGLRLELPDRLWADDGLKRRLTLPRPFTGAFFQTAFGRTMD